MVAVHVRDVDLVNLPRLYARGRKALRQAACRRSEHLGATGIEQHQLLPGVDEKRVDRKAHRRRRPATRGQQRFYQFRVGLQYAGRDIDESVQHRRDLEIAELHTMHTDGLTAGHRCLAKRRGNQRRINGQRGTRGAGKQDSAANGIH
ncbi:MAG: hypothetical protein NT115_03540 [Proteobacteria bacterium]|nr:hypothetical protein [Pseudomonadota bacterium]